MGDEPQKLNEVNAKELCLVTEVVVISFLEKGLITVIRSSGMKLTGKFTYNGDIKNWLGQVVYINKEKTFDTLECKELKKIFGHFTDFFSFAA